jgi:integrase
MRFGQYVEADIAAHLGPLVVLFGALYDAIPTHELQLLVETDIETGLRWGELIELRVRDIDRDTGVITVSRVAGNSPPSSTPYRAQRRAAGKDSPRQPRRLATDGKGGKIVTIPLAPRTARAVDLAIGERLDGPIFLRPDGQRMDRHCASRIVRRSMAR